MADGICDTSGKSYEMTPDVVAAWDLTRVLFGRCETARFEAVLAALRAAEERGRAAAVRAIEAVPVEELAAEISDARGRGDEVERARWQASTVVAALLAAVRGPAPVVEARDNSEFERRLARERLRVADAVRPQLDALDRTTRVTAADLATVVGPAPSGKE